MGTRSEMVATEGGIWPLLVIAVIAIATSSCGTKGSVKVEAELSWGSDTTANK
jgi:lactobin A/cerein 7B family class IIb bacteriocin